MKAEPVLDELYELGEGAYAELRAVRLVAPVAGSAHPFKYSLALVVRDVCVLRYDNEAGKGDHRHRGEDEQPYRFTSLEQSQVDFWMEVNELWVET